MCILFITIYKLPLPNEFAKSIVSNYNFQFQYILYITLTKSCMFATMLHKVKG